MRSWDLGAVVFSLEIPLNILSLLRILFGTIIMNIHWIWRLFLPKKAAGKSVLFKRVDGGKSRFFLLFETNMNI